MADQDHILKHKIFAEKMTSRIISEFNPQEQNEILKIVAANIKEDRKQKIETVSKAYETLKKSLDGLQ